MTRTNVTQAADALGFRQAHVGVGIAEVRKDVAATAKLAVELPPTRACAAAGPHRAPDLPPPIPFGTKVLNSNIRTECAMPLVTVKPKFQVTIPAKLRRGINLHEGDIMEATIVGKGILFRPMDVVDRNVAADRIAANFAAAGTSSEDSGQSEHEVMQEAIADIADARRERRDRET